MNSKTSANIGHVLAAIAIAVTLALGVTGLVYNAYSRDQTVQETVIDKLEKKVERNAESIHETQMCIGTIQLDIQYIKKSQDESRKMQEKILEKLH